MNKQFYIGLLMAFLILSACKKNGATPENPTNQNAQELITTVILNGYDKNNPTDATKHFSISWKDLDGTGGNTPTTDTLTLDTGVTYQVEVLLLDQSKTPFDTISNEVFEERNVHQFFYTLSSALTQKINVLRLDYDTNVPALPLGLSLQINPVATAPFATPFIGSLNIVLSHYDGVPKTTTPSTESDLDITFPVKLK